LISSSPATDALWLELFQRVCGNVAHELKGALNGVSLNLEVVRSRSQKPDTPTSSVATFAGSAASQFDAVMDMTEGLLALSRATPGAVDLPSTVRWLVALVAPAAQADGRELRIEGSLASLGASPVESSAARSAIASALLSATESASKVVCRAKGEVLEITGENGERLAPPPHELLSVIREVGIELHAESSAISITFPR
jgi:signal transduction histidine kinase